jgi:hypothetical protein
MSTYFADTVSVVAETATKVVDLADCDRSVHVRPNGGTSVYVGYDDSLGSADGFPIEIAKDSVFFLPAGRELWVYMLTSSGVKLFVGALH